MWSGISVACLVAGYALLIATFAWFGYYMSEGVLETETLEGNLFVALNSDPIVLHTLLSACHSKVAYQPSVSRLEASGLLAEVPSGTKMHMTSFVDYGGIYTMTIAEGRLKGRQVWACYGQFALSHAMP